MKRLFILLLLIMVLLSSCGVGIPTESTQGTEDSKTQVNETLVQSVDDMIKIDGVLSVSKMDEYCTSGESVYTVEFEVDGLRLHFELALPNDYTDNDYPTVLYFPDVGSDAEFLVDNFAKKKINVLRLFQRGIHDNEGIKDFCGKDFEDAEKLLEICEMCSFLSNGGIFAAGAATGSVYALKLTATHPDLISGCAVVDPICDFDSFIEFRGEDMKQMMLALIGCDEGQFPFELEERSAKYFSNSISCPVLIFCYEDSPAIPNTQAEMLKELLDINGTDTELCYLSPLGSDFNGTAFLKLIPWIMAISDKQK